MEDPIITIPERKLSYSFMFGEAAWMLSGRNDVASVAKYVDGVNGPANKNRLCVKGRFGFDYVSNPERLTKPLIRINGKPKDLHPNINFSNIHEYFREASWEEALDFASEGLKKIKSEKRSSSNI